MEARKATAAAEQRASRPTDPVFLALVEHTESVRTEHGLIALRRLGKELDADLMQISLHKNGNLHISITANDRHYSVWYRPDGLTTVESYETTTDKYGEKSWTDVDRYSSTDGVTLANGHSREGGE